jgi:hypothetical protein
MNNNTGKFQKKKLLFGKQKRRTISVHFLTSDESWARVGSTTLASTDMSRAGMGTTNLAGTNMSRAGMGTANLINTNMCGEWMSLASSADWGCLGSGDSGHVIGLGLGDFGCVLDLDGRYRIVDGSDGQVVGQDAEATGVGGVGDTDFLAFWVEVSVAADLVAETVTEVSGGLSGVSVAEAGLAELVLGVVLGGGERRVAVGDGISSSGNGSGHGTVSEILSLGGNSQHQQASNLHKKKTPNKLF